MQQFVQARLLCVQQYNASVDMQEEIVLQQHNTILSAAMSMFVSGRYAP